jgi:hypothetical protein
VGRSIKVFEPGGVRTDPDGGQVAPLLALVVVVAVVVALGLGRLGAVVVDRAAARTAADAAALAGVDGGRAAADQLARANHGVVEQFVVVGPDTEVTVRVGRARATARARRGRLASAATIERGG